MNGLTGKRPIGWRRAAAICWREARSTPGKFLFVVISVAIGVAALVGVRGFNESFQHTLLGQARGLMAADLSAHLMRRANAQELEKATTLEKSGIQTTWVTEMVSMASTPSDPVPLLVSLKAVDPSRYPFYGTASVAPSGTLREVLTDQTAVVGEDLLIRLKVKIGDPLQIGDGMFRIAGILQHEPDRLTAAAGLGPRVMISRAGLDRSGLMQLGSRGSDRLLLRLDPQEKDVAGIRKRVEAMLPDANVTDFREANPFLTDRLNHATEMLSLICLVAMVLGAIGVAMAMRAHLQQHMDTLAIMKSIGARSSDILRIYVLQTLLLGLAGGVLGVALGLCVEWILPSFLVRLLPLRPEMRFPWRSILGGLGTGVLTTLLFCLPPLLDVRRVRPNLVLRRAVEGSEGGTKASWLNWWRERKIQIVAVVLLLLALGGIAAALSDSWKVGRAFAVALVAVLVVLLSLAAGLLRLLRFFLNRVRLHLPTALRHGLANLYRPGNQSPSVLAALGTGVMLILTLYLTQNMMVSDINRTIGSGIPNVFFIDISSRELSGVQQLLAHQSGVGGHPEYLPVVGGRVSAINGVPEEQLKLPKFVTRGSSLSWSDELPLGDRIVQGKWWPPGEGNGVAVDEHAAQRLHVQLGTKITFLAGTRSIEVPVVALIHSDGQHIYARTSFVLPERVLAGLPVIWYAAAHVEPKKVADVEAALFAKYPTVTVINVADVFSMIEGVASQITMVVRFLAGFSMLAGVMILASSVASTRFRRIREVVVLKTLGATRRHVLSVFSVEFMVLGVLAGSVGVVFANLLTRFLLHLMQMSFHLEWAPGAVTLVATGILATATGWVASYRILGQKPLEILREE